MEIIVIIIVAIAVYNFYKRGKRGKIEKATYNAISSVLEVYKNFLEISGFPLHFIATNMPEINKGYFKSFTIGFISSRSTILILEKELKIKASDIKSIQDADNMFAKLPKGYPEFLRKVSAIFSSFFLEKYMMWDSEESSLSWVIELLDGEGTASDFMDTLSMAVAKDKWAIRKSMWVFFNKGSEAAYCYSSRDKSVYEQLSSDTLDIILDEKLVYELLFKNL